MKRLAALCLMFLCGFVSAQEAEPQSGIFLIKTDSLGNVEWEQVYAEGEDCYGFGKPTSDGGYMVMASIECTEEEYLWLAKTNSKGNIVWKKKIVSASKEKETVFLCDFIETDDGYLIKVHQCEMFRERECGVLFIKIDKKGKMVWNRLADKDIRLQAFGPIIPCKDGGQVCTGGFAICLIKLDTLYRTAWVKYYEELGVASVFYRAKQAHDGGFIVVGLNTQKEPSEWRSFLIKTDSVGSVEWFKDYESGDISDATVASDGEYVLTGHLEKNVWLLKLDENGDTLWTRTYGDSESNDYGCEIISNSDGSFTVLAGTQTFNDSEPEMLFLKVNSHGDTLWINHTHWNPPYDYREVFAKTLDGGYILSGYRRTTSERND